MLGFSKQSFYEWRAKPVTGRDWDDAHLIDAAMAIHADDPAFGYRFIADELPDHGITAGENRLQRLCPLQRLVSVHSQERGLNRKPGPMGSMGRVGACADKAAMESFFAPLQKNVLDRQRWSTREELRLAIVTWIEKTYHRRRRQRRLGRLALVEFETVNYGLHVG